MHPRRRVLPTALLLLALASLATAAPAYADSIAVKRAEAARVEAQVAALNDKAEIAAENYDAARENYNELSDKVRETERRIAKLEKRQDTLQTHLDTRANDMYREGPLGFLSVMLDVRSFEDFDTTIRVLKSLNAQDAATVSQLKAAKAAAQKAHESLVSQKAAAGRQKVAMAANATAVRAQLAARKQLLAGLTAEIQTLIAQKIAQEKAAEQARTMALLLKQREAKSGGIVLGGAPPSSSTAAAAVYWAEKEIGKPYVWAAAGPDSFDCSGLMVWAYGHAGVNLSHYSRAQIDEGSRVSRDNLQPGDLVFFGSPIHHVGMYVGGGNFIEAPYTGTDVRISQLDDRHDFAGATRP